MPIFEVMLRSHHRYALQSVYLVGSLRWNGWWGVSFYVGVGGGGGCLGAVIIGCVVYGILCYNQTKALI